MSGDTTPDGRGPLLRLGELPDWFRIRQRFPRPVEPAPGAALERAMAELLPLVRVGDRVAITAGSRKITGLRDVVVKLVGLLRARGAEPFVVPAMGSHGGATPDGQLRVLDDLNGITERSIGCPIRSSLDVVSVGRTPAGFEVLTDAVAAAADWVVIVGRIKPHTIFTGRVESGICKMLVIGLGNQVGASSIHRHALRHDLGETIVDAARLLLAAPRPRLLCGIGIIENAYKDIAELLVVAADDPERLLDAEARALERARALVPQLPVDDLDALIVDDIGKDISGSGLDPAVVGRKSGAVRPRISTLYVRRLTPASHGNAIGIGYADIVHQSVVSAMDPGSTYTNAVTAGRLLAARIPMPVAADRSAMDAIVQLRSADDPRRLRAAWIADTSSLDTMWVTAPVADELVAGERGIEVLDGPCPLELREDGSMTLGPGHPRPS